MRSPLTPRSPDEATSWGAAQQTTGGHALLRDPHLLSTARSTRYLSQS